MNAINKNEVSMFKVGDKVVYVSSEVDFLDDSEIHDVSLVTENGLYKVQGLYFSENSIRRATPEEIAAGHRIDLETLRDCDTSPNYKKFDERVNSYETK